MYCPRCGNGGQEPESYCRKCGAFLLDYTGRSSLLGRLWSGSTPSNQIYVGLALNLITILTCFLLIGFLNGYYDARAARTGEGTPGIVYLVFAFLAVISLWQFLSLAVGVRLGRKLSRRRSIQSGETELHSNIPDAGARPELSTRPLNEGLPIPITEESTRILEQRERK